jgi:hypothetical protein
VQEEASTTNPWIHEVQFRAEGIQDAYGNETLQIVAYDCGSPSMKIHYLDVQIFIQGFDHLPRPLNGNSSIDMIQFKDRSVSLQGFDPESDRFQIEFVNAEWTSRNGTSFQNMYTNGNTTIAASVLLPQSLVLDPDGRILLIAPENFGGPGAVKIIFRYRSTKNSLASTDFFLMVNILCAVKYRYLESEKSCVLCKLGTICKTIGMIEPELCKPGSYSDDATTCSPCLPGTFSDKAGSGSCSLCPAGYYQPSSNQSSCIPCSPGTFKSDTGGVRCNECGHTSFSGSGASRCTLCPSNTNAFTKLSTNVTDCRCKEGYYERHNRAGYPCLPCCDGAICRGQRSSPFPLENFWSDKSLWNTSCYFVPCYDTGACQGYPLISIPEISDIDDIVDVLAVCNDGLEGRFCSRCKAGFWRSIGAVCIQCNLENKDRAGALYFAWVLLYLLGYVLFFYLSFSTLRVVTTLYTHNSMMFLLSKMRVTFPQVLANIFGIHAFFAMDFTFLPHTCMSMLLGYEPLDYGQTTIFFLCIPLFMVASVAAQYAWVRVCKRYGPSLVHRMNSKHDEEDDDSKIKIMSLILKIMSKNGEFLTDEDIQASLHRGIHSILQGILGMWPIIAVKSLELLFCDSLQSSADEKNYLIANPDWICFEGSHRKIFPVALFFVCFYVIGIPWYLISILM